MAKVTAFDSIGEMHEHARRQREAADAQIQSWQNTVRPGAKIVRVTEANGNLLLIYGSIVDPIASERASYDLNDPLQEAEFDHIAKRYGSVWQRSFRYGRFYSPLCTEGEFGNIHLATITAEITEAEFEAARAQGWPQDFAFAKGAVTRRSFS